MRVRRLILLLPAGLALVLGVNGGLSLLGLPSAPVSQRLPDVHGFLLVLGFVGTLVALERAVALRRPRGFAAPVLLGAGGLVLVSPLPLRAGQSLLVAGAAALLGVYLMLWRRQRDDAVLVQALGAVLALGGAVLWLGGVPVPRLLPRLAGFVVLTIAGERLELARLEMAGAGTPPPSSLGRGLWCAPRWPRSSGRAWATPRSASCSSGWSPGSAPTTSRAVPCAPAASRGSSPPACSPGTPGSRRQDWSGR